DAFPARATHQSERLQWRARFVAGPWQAAQEGANRLTPPTVGRRSHTPSVCDAVGGVRDHTTTSVPFRAAGAESKNGTDPRTGSPASISTSWTVFTVESRRSANNATPMLTASARKRPTPR